MFTYPGDPQGVEPGRSGRSRVNLRPGVDASGIPGRDPKGDAAHVF